MDPSGEKATDLTHSLWPRRMRREEPAAGGVSVGVGAAEGSAIATGVLREEAVTTGVESEAAMAGGVAFEAAVAVGTAGEAVSARGSSVSLLITNTAATPREPMSNSAM